MNPRTWLVFALLCMALAGCDPAQPSAPPLRADQPSPLPMATTAVQRIEPPPVLRLPDERMPITCMNVGAAWQCHDQLLDTSFAYPEFMGRIAHVEQRLGGYDGLIYEYQFVDGEIGVAAGGRSENFSAGRGPMYTDQSGFHRRTPADVCGDWRATTCEEIKPGVVFMVIYPQSAWFCADIMAPAPSPRAIVAVDLASHPLIQGLGFTAAVLPPAREQEWLTRWFDNRTASSCDAAAQAEFDQEMAELHTTLTAGAADREIQARYDGLRALAASVDGSYVGDPATTDAPSSMVLREVVTAVLAGDVTRLTSLVHYTSVPCTTIGALGGPPQCREDEHAGAMVDGLPILEAEGVMARPDEMHGVMATLVSRQPTPMVVGRPHEVFTDPTWLPADAVVIFVDAESRQATALLVDATGIVRMYYGRALGEVYARVAGSGK